jgi:hypothetical protein
MGYKPWIDYPDFLLLFLQESHRFHSIFLQISCNSYLQQLTVGLEKAFAPLNRIFTKLDSDFYTRRWSKTSDRQREMLMTAIFEKVIHVVRR